MSDPIPQIATSEQLTDISEDIDWKLRRALFHAQTLNRAAQEFFESQFYTVRRETSEDGRIGVVTVETVQPTPSILGILAGDAAHQLRSSLDHLMWMFAWPIGEKQENRVEFPIAYSRAEYVGRRGGKGIDPLPGTRYKMPRVARGVRAVIESLQPYNSGKCKDAESLGDLRCISNWDKHRALITSVATVRVTDLGLRFEGDVRLVSQETFVGPLKPGAILGRIEVAYGEGRGDVYMKPKLALQPTFDDGMPERIRGKPVVTTLSIAGDFILREVIPRLAKFL